MSECGGSRRTTVVAGAEPLLALGLLALLAETEALNSGMGIISLAAVAAAPVDVPVLLRLDEEDDDVAPPPRLRRCSVEEEEEDEDGAWLLAAAAV